MPPQPGVFALPYNAAHKTRTANNAEIVDMPAPQFHPQPAAGSSRNHGAPLEDPKNKKRREMAGKLAKDMSERREDVGKHYTEIISDLHSTSIQLSTRPETLPVYNLRLYPISLERSALLPSLGFQEKHMLDVVQTAYEEEREKVEEEWRKGRERIKERLLEGIEERRKRAREEKEGEGAVADGSIDSQSRAHNTRKLRNKIGGTSPPPTPLSSGPQYGANGVISSITSGPITSGPFLNPHSLSVDELPSPFPLPLTSTHSSNAAGYAGGAAGAGTSKRRAKGGGRETQAVGGLGKSLSFLSSIKETEIDHDLFEIRRGNKRRRGAATTAGGKS